MRDTTRAFFRYETFVTILEHFKLKFSKSIHWLGKYKIIFPLSVSDQRWILYLPRRFPDR